MFTLKMLFNFQKLVTRYCRWRHSDLYSVLRLVTVNSVFSRPYFSKGQAIGMSCRPSVVFPSLTDWRMYCG